MQHSCDEFTTPSFPSPHPLKNLAAPLTALSHSQVRKYVYRDADNLDTAFDAGGKVSIGLTATTIVSQWTWSATLLQSSTVASKVRNLIFKRTYGRRSRNVAYYIRMVGGQRPLVESRVPPTQPLLIFTTFWLS